jgi:hypothetical protein
MQMKIFEAAYKKKSEQQQEHQQSQHDGSNASEAEFKEPENK